jgi:ribonuclease R
MPDPTSERILKFIGASTYRPQKVRALARSMGVEEEEYGEFRESIKSLMRSGRIVLGGGNAVMLPRTPGMIVGTYRAHARGFGFVVPESPDEHGDLYVPPGESGGAITGDTVRARILRKGKRGTRMLHEGRIVEVLARGNSQFVGELKHEAGRWFVWPDGNTLNAPIEVADVTAKSARAGDQVVVELTEYPRGPQPARGVIMKRLGRSGEAAVAVRSIIYQYHLPEQFPEEVLNEARRVTRSFSLDRELARREDLRNEVIFTIDPDDAKDFDDAISLRTVSRIHSRHSQGEWELGVHIADVSTFVKPGGPLDAEAYQRGNSVYFPGHVIPMLPEILSNGLCSLQEGQPRLVKSAFIRYDAKGRPVSSRFANAVIQSKKRLTYLEASGILEGKTGGFPRDVVETLREMEKLARTIRQRRRDEGMLVLDLPEVELVLDEKGNVVGAEPADASFSHTLIEMFMVEANEAVARLFARLGVPCLRRIHPEPDTETSQQLGLFLRLMGHTLPRAHTRKDLQALLDATRGRPEGFAVHMAVLRSMEKAVYSPKNVGHYALASEDYCHFTSPIRRYPDLTIHRLLDLYLDHKIEARKDRRTVPHAAQLLETGAHFSFAERRAEDAEREIKKVLVLHLLARRLGEESDGVVTGVANVGVFVQLREFLIDGLIRFADLPDDWWELDQRQGILVGQRSGRKIRIGDRLRVRIAAVNIPARELDLAPVEPKAAGRKAQPVPASAASHGVHPRGRVHPRGLTPASSRREPAHGSAVSRIPTGRKSEAAPAESDRGHGTHGKHLGRRTRRRRGR